MPHGQATVYSTTSVDEHDTAERTCNPLWTRARTLLNYLTYDGMICRDIWEARLGQFVLVKGALIVLDASLLKAAWDKPEIEDQ